MTDWISRVVALVMLCVAPTAAIADDRASRDRVTLGWGRAFVNDAIGDFHDRWRTGSYTVSLVRGPSWTGRLPSDFGAILEVRARAELISPANLANPARNDRRYAAIMSLGLHSHFDFYGLEASLGTDLVVTGPQTGLTGFQEQIHRIIGSPAPRGRADQIPNGFHPTLVAELGQSRAFGRNGTFRPFVEVQAGIETFVRGGFDLSLGEFTKGALMLREQVTGQRYRAVKGSPTPGYTFTLGGDVAHVFNSRLLPDGGPAPLNDTRVRLRAGVAWQGKSSSVFFGVTWLGKEFETQPQGQLVGTLNLRLVF